MTGRLRRAIARLTADDDELASHELRGEAEQAGATAVSLGGPLVGDALKGGSRTALAERARRTINIAAEARSAR